MNKLLTAALLSALIAPLSACQKSSAPKAQIIVEYHDYEDYEVWKKEREEDALALPFKPALLTVNGIGKVKAAPDVAVITGTIKATDDFDHRVVDEAAQVMNEVQNIIAGQDIRLSFTRIAASEQRDPKCLRANQEARFRHNQIIQDNRHNARVKRDKDTKLKPRPPKPRIAQKVCPVTHIDGYVSFTAWVRPVELAGDILNDFTTAGVTSVQLYGYDFSDYDALYQQASAMAVENAKAKAKLAAKTAGTKLTTLEQFYVDPPQRVSRFGPQAMIISNHGNRSVAAGRYRSTQEPVLAIRAENIGALPSPMLAESRAYGDYEADEIVVTASRQRAPSDRFNSSNASGGQTPKPAPVQNNAPTFAGNANNALRMTLLAGPQTVSVNATLGYLYETPLNGVVILDD